MLPIMISHGAPFSFVIRILLAKLVVGILAGFAVDGVIRLIRKKRKIVIEPQIEEFCERENCRCGDHFAVSAIRHTVKITLFILAFTFLLNVLIHSVGEDRLADLILTRPILANLLSAVVGLIPNCASSVVLTEAFLSGAITFGTCAAGLCANAGMGFVVLLRNTRKWKRNLLLIGVCYAVSVLVGLLLNVFPL
jgi:hypothetical protein